MRILELFSGTGSVTKICEQLGHTVVSVDICNKFHIPTHCVDILQWDYTQYDRDYFDIIWASPPCNTFSKMTFLTKTKDRQLQDELDFGLPCLRKAQEIIGYFNHKYHFIENPASGRMGNYMDTVPKIVNYCQYGFQIQKRTHIWTNKDNFQPKRCYKKTCRYYGNHPHKIGTTRAGQSSKLRKIELKYRIPGDLIMELLSE